MEVLRPAVGEDDECERNGNLEISISRITSKVVLGIAARTLLIQRVPNK